MSMPAPQAAPTPPRVGGPAVITPEPTPAGSPVTLPEPVLLQTLLATPLFAGCTPAELGEVLPGVQAYECPASAVLLAMDEPGGVIGLIIGGSARVAMGSPGDETAVHDVLNAPDVFGEVALLSGGAQPYSVTATSPCRLIWLTKRATSVILAKLPRVGLRLGQRLAARFRVLAAPPLAMLTPSVEDEWAVVEPPEAPAPKPVDPPTIPNVEANAPKGIRFVELSEFDLQPSVLNLIPARLIRQHRLLPVKLADKKLTLAMVAPKNMAATAEIGRLLQTLELEVVAISQDDFNSALNRLKLEDPRGGSKADLKALKVNPDSISLEAAELERDATPPPKTVGEDVIRLVNRIIAAALEREASDVHLEPTSNGLRVRFRVSGVLEDWSEAVPSTHARGVIARLKVVGGVDITERRRPQDGRISIKAGKREVDVRLSTMPSSRGEKIVMRVLDSSAGSRPLGQLFLDPRVLGMARKALNRPFGGVVIAGATGSGKTSTLYSMLHERRQTRPDTHVVMVEDPIEFRLEGLTQVQVDHAAGLEFATVLRSTLRQDPDVIVVGEMRDAETARIGLEAAMTGHLLLTSVHANGAVATVERLEQLGCGRPLISQALAQVLVQRLVRRLCAACKTTQQVPQALLDSLIARRILPAGANPALPHAPGCDACQRTGYVGRVAVIEALHLTDDVRHMIAAGDEHTTIHKHAVQTGALVGFNAYAGYLLEQGLIGPGEALLAVAD